MSDSKVGKSTGQSPLEQLMEGTKKGSEGAEHGLTAFPEVIEDGWTVATVNPAVKGLEKIGTNREEKLMVVPDDDGDFAFVTRVHEQAHVAKSPTKEDLLHFATRSGIPPAVLHAVEDGRINGHLIREVEGYALALRELPWPLDNYFFKKSVEDGREMLPPLDPTDQESVDLHAEYENETRVTVACMMAALMHHRGISPHEWRELGESGYLTEEQLDMVYDFCNALPDMSFEDMVGALQELFDLLYVEPPACEAAEVLGVGEGDGDAEDGEGGPGDGEPGTRPGVGGKGYAPEGIDQEEIKPAEDVYADVSGASDVEQKVAPIEKPKPIFTGPKSPTKRLPSAISRTLVASGNKVAGFRPELFTGKSRVSFSNYNVISSGGAVWEPMTTKAVEAAKEMKRLRDLAEGEDDISEPFYGVTVKEENYLARSMGGGYDNETFVRAEMEVLDDFERTEQAASPIGTTAKSHKQDRVGYMTNPVRAMIDGRVYRRKRRSVRQKPAGSLLLDLSGSMSPSSKMLVKCLEIAPYAVIGGYAGDDCERGYFAILAQDGLAVDQETLRYLIKRMGGGNSVDFTALEWLAEQPKPRVWVSDGFICGTPSDTAGHIHRAFQLCREAGIIRVHQLAQLVGFEPLVNNLRHELRR